MLLDSNTIIYASLPENQFLRDWISKNTPFLSIVSYVEVLGFHRITNEEKLAFQAFFDSATLLPITLDIVQKATALRQRKKMSLGDALIAATAIVHSHTLVTSNTSDFLWVAELTLWDPFQGL